MKIVIGIPAYNEEKNIAAILIKLKKISQHIIVCDDGSNDNTQKVLSKYKDQSKFVILQNKNNHGLGYTLNKCLKFINHPYVCVLNGDDYLLRNSLNVVVTGSHGKTTTTTFI